MDWDPPPTCDPDEELEDPTESLLPSDQGEGNEVDLFTTMIYDLYPKEDKPLER